MLVAVVRNLMQALRTYHFSVVDLQELKRRKLARSLRWAYDYVPLHHSRFKSIGLTPADIGDPRDLTRLPTMSRSDLIDNYRKGITAAGLRPDVTFETTGTTGVALRMEWSSAMRDVRGALALRRLLVAGVRPWHRLVTIWPPKVNWRFAFERSGRRRASTTVMETAWVLGRPLPTARILVSTPDDLSLEARAIRKLNPDFIVARPSHLRRLGARLEEEAAGMTPKGLLLTGEDVTSGSMREMQRAFQSKPFRMYGSTETGTLGGDCRAQRGIHLNEDYIICEVIRDGEQVGPGEVGELVITTLHNNVMPLVRYRMGDLVELSDEGRCDCGSSLMRLRSIQGRKEDGLVTARGERLPVLQTADIIESATGLYDFQIRQVSIDHLVIRLSHCEVVDPKLVQILTSCLSKIMGLEPVLTFERRPEEELWAKARPVISSVR